MYGVENLRESLICYSLSQPNTDFIMVYSRVPYYCTQYSGMAADNLSVSHKYGS